MMSYKVRDRGIIIQLIFMGLNKAFNLGNRIMKHYSIIKPLKVSYIRYFLELYKYRGLKCSISIRVLKFILT